MCITGICRIAIFRDFSRCCIEDGEFVTVQLAIDSELRLSESVRDAAQRSQPLRIRGSGSKDFYGRPIAGDVLDVSGHRGIVSYEPSELVVTARCGTPLAEIQDTLGAAGQMLAFEPPWFGPDATIGGTIACGFSGPRRPFSGSARDFVLGIKIMNNKGEVVSFGGQVMKNVAGYDVSRLMTGALGTLGVILEVSLKVLPNPEAEQTYQLSMDAQDALNEMVRLSALPIPLSAGSHDRQVLRVRLSGTARGVESASKELASEFEEADNDYWQRLKEHELNFFTESGPLWRISMPSDAPVLDIPGHWITDWAGALRWGFTSLEFEQVQAAVQRLGGHACIFRSQSHDTDRFAKLSSPIAKIHERLKQSFDPAGIFNPGILYADI